MKGNYVMLRAGALRLVVQQGEVGAAHYLDDESRAAGHYRYEGLSDEMKAMPVWPHDRFIAAPFTGDAIAWCWDEIRVLIDHELRPVELPAVLRATNSPVEAYVEIDGEPAFFCRAEKVRRFAFTAEAAP